MRVTIFRLIGIPHYCFLSFTFNYIIMVCVCVFFNAGTA